METNKPMSDGTATPTPAEWPALRAAWAQGTVRAEDVRREPESGANAYMLLSKMVRRGLLERVAPGAYVATHSRATMASYVMGEE
jgi:predicted transcriptional regulator of viral defense system